MKVFKLWYFAMQLFCPNNHDQSHCDNSEIRLTELTSVTTVNLDLTSERANFKDMINRDSF